jgi:HlyD family secretion protein
MSNAILEDSELVFHHGLNLKMLRYNNLNLSKAEKALDSAKTELMKTEIIAPFDGIIVDVPAREGDVISTVDLTARTIVELVDTSIIELDGYVDERDIRNISLNQYVDVYVDVVQDKTLSGKVSFVSPYGNLQTGTAKFLIKIALDPADILLQRGLSATAVIPLGNHNDILLVPSGAVRFSSGEYWVHVVTDQKSGEVEKRVITPGMQNDDFIEVVSGLKENEVVTLNRLSN